MLKRNTERYFPPGEVLGSVVLGLLAFVVTLPPAANALDGAAGSVSYITEPNPPNTAEAEKSPYVVLVSFDGFRYDYVAKYGAMHLVALGKAGAYAPAGMVPSFPSITFPNHYSIVTGLYPEHHGIVGMDFYDPARKQEYSYKKPAATDGSWYGGTPLWALAEQQGMRAACLMWPGSEAQISGKRPSYWVRFDDFLNDERRIQQVGAWLKEPPATRPHLIAMYFSNVDHAGHDYGPDTEQTREAVKHLDAVVGMLQAELARTNLPVNLVVVADHGMMTRQEDWITLEDYADLSHVIVEDGLLYAENEEATEKLYQQLKKASSLFKVYRRKNLPPELNDRDNPRTGDPVIVLNGPYQVRGHRPLAGTPDKAPKMGVHGMDPYVFPQMKAIFYAAGPQIRQGVELAPFSNVNVYPMLAHILRLQAPAVDGSLNVLSGILKDNGDSPEK